MLLGLTLFGAYREFAGSLTCLTSDLGSGTIACAIAPSMETLILARAVAGMGGGGYVVTGSFCKVHSCCICFRVMTGKLGAAALIAGEN
jgi:MFS family permease